MSPTDDQLPSLKKFGSDLSAAAARLDAAAAPAHRRRVKRRRVRRLIIATAALFVVTPAAIATKAFWSITPDSADPLRSANENRTRAVIIAAGSGHDSAWQLSAYQDKARGLCLALYADTKPRASQSSGCQPLRRGDVNVAFAGSAAGMFIYGAVTAETQTIHLTNSGRTQTVTATRPDPEALKPGQIRPGTFKVFVIPVTQLDPSRLKIIAYDASGRPVGRFPKRR